MSTDLTLEFHRNDICILVNTATKRETNGKTCWETPLKEVVKWGSRTFEATVEDLPKRRGQRRGEPAS
jgi:hypothetical protein